MLLWMYTSAEGIAFVVYAQLLQSNCCLQDPDSGYMDVFSTTVEFAMASFLWRMSQLLECLPEGQLLVCCGHNR